jgi:ADP-ribose pyrophosphatase
MPSKKAVTRDAKRNALSQKPRTKNKVEVLSSKTVFRGRIFRVDVDRVREPSGVVVRRDVVRHGGSVVILAVDDASPEPLVLLERQYRYAAGQDLWEIPAGSIDPGETPLSGARRELLEETGYRARHWSRALFFYPTPGFVDETMIIYLARGLTPGPSQPEDDEFITCKLLPLSRVVDLILSGRIRDGKTIAAALWLAETRRRQSGRGQPAQ